MTGASEGTDGSCLMCQEQGSVDIGIDVLVDALRILVMLQMRFPVIEERNTNQRRMKNSEKLIQPDRKKEVFMGGLMSGHHETVLHESEKKEAEDIRCPIRVMLQKPKIHSYKRIGHNDMHRSMSVALVLAEFGHLVP